MKLLCRSALSLSAMLILLALPHRASALEIHGAGGTFPQPLYAKWFWSYHQSHSEVQIDYDAVGSSAAIKALMEETVFFGGTDGPMTNEQLKASPGPVLHFPTVLGAVVPIYNVPGVSQQIRFSGGVLARIFLGKLTKWNDPAIRKENPGVVFPGLDIAVVHRSEGSGTNYVFCDYLSKVSPEFAKQVGVATSVNWPTGTGAKGNGGIADLVKQTPGAIGYVEYFYAFQNKIPFGSVWNRKNRLIQASPESVTAAAASAKMPADFRVSITDSSGDDAYPISSFTWLLLYENPADKEKARAMVEFIKWALVDGQAYCARFGYAQVPAQVVTQEMEALKKIKI